MMMAKAKNLRGGIDLDLDYQMLRKKKIIERIFASQKGTTEVSNYFRYLELSRSTDFLQKQFVAKKLALLTELRKRPSPSPKRLMKICRQFYSLLLVVQRNFEQMFLIDSSSKNLRNYASFVSNILNITPLMKLVVDKADELDSKRVEQQNSIETQAALFNQKNAVFVISGEILDVNLGGIDMFGFTTSAEMVGMNISTMMPSPYSEMHNGFLKKYLQTGVTSILDVVRTVVARDKLGFLFEVRLYVRQLIDRKGAFLYIYLLKF
jgi:PAS domain S-box-containing protein